MPEARTHDHGPLQYTCPMHPFIIKDKPGACPICGMTLVPVKKADDRKPKEGELEMLEHVSLSPTQMVMANVATVTVDKLPLTKEIVAVGIVQYDQSRQAKVTAWVAGRIDRLYVSTVGAYVSKGRPVAEVYSPDLVSAQQEYLLALKSREQLKDSSIQAISQGGEGLVASARQRLKLLGVKDHQIASLEKSGQPNIRLSIYTPLSGIVIEKIVLQGQYVNVGDPLFTIADLSSVWVEAEVYESDFSFDKNRPESDYRLPVLSRPGLYRHGLVHLPVPRPENQNGQGARADCQPGPQAETGHVCYCLAEDTAWRRARRSGSCRDGQRQAESGLGRNEAGHVCAP